MLRYAVWFVRSFLERELYKVICVCVCVCACVQQRIMAHACKTLNRTDNYYELYWWWDVLAAQLMPLCSCALKTCLYRWIGRDGSLKIGIVGHQAFDLAFLPVGHVKGVVYQVRTETCGITVSHFGCCSPFFALDQATKAQRWSTCVALLFL